MKFKISKSNYQMVILAIIPLFIMFAIDPTFNIQSIVIPIAAMMFGVLVYKGELKLYKVDLLIGVLFVFPILVSMLYNAMFAHQSFNELYFIRIAYTILILVFYFMATSVKLDMEQINLIFVANIIAGIIVSLYFILVKPIWYTNLIGTTIDKNFSAGLLVIQGELAVISFFNTQKKREKITFFIAYCIIVLGIFYSASRAAVLVILGGTMLLVADILIPISKRKRGFAKVVIAILVLFLIGVSFLPEIFDILSSNDKYAWYWKRYFVNSYNDKSNTARLSYWRDALEMWANRPVFGLGIGVIDTTGNSSAVSHCTYIDYMVDQGVVGLLGFLGVCYRSMKNIFWGEQKKYRSVGISLLLLSLILSATRSVLLWYTLIIVWLIGNVKEQKNP